MRISKKHRDRYRDYYAAHPTAVMPSVWVERVQALVQRVHAKTVLDYGSGPSCGLSRFLPGVQAFDYDPGVPELMHRERRADLVCCIHTLEHVENVESLENVMENLRKLAKRALFIVVSCQESTKVLPDGTPWHTFVRDYAWWRAYLWDFIEQPPLKDAGREYAALLEMA